MRPILIVLIFIIVLIALIMAYLLIVSNTRSEKGGPTVFDMMMRNREEPSEGPKEGEEENSLPASEENRVEPTKQTEDES